MLVYIMGQRRKLVEVIWALACRVDQRSIVVMGKLAIVAVRKPKTCYRKFVAHTHVHLANKTCYVKTCHQTGRLILGSCIDIYVHDIKKNKIFRKSFINLEIWKFLQFWTTYMSIPHSGVAVQVMQQAAFSPVPLSSGWLTLAAWYSGLVYRHILYVHGIKKCKCLGMIH
jgi:hypothetical protein